MAGKKVRGALESLQQPAVGCGLRAIGVFADGGAVEMDHGLRQKELNASKKAMKSALSALGDFAYDAVVPQDAVDVGLMVAGGPFGRAARKAGAALAALAAADDADAANWLRLFTGHGAPIVGSYDVSRSTGRFGRGVYLTDSPNYASMRAFSGSAEAPVVYPVDVDVDRVLQLHRKHPALGGKTWKQVYEENAVGRMPPRRIEELLDSLGVAGAEYPSHIVAPFDANPARMFVIRDLSAVKSLDGSRFASGGAVGV